MGGSSSKKKQATEAKGANNNNTKRQAAQAQVSSKDRAVLDLKNARDRLKRYQTRLDTEAQVLHESARKLLQADKRERAKLALKMKKFKEQQIQQADGHLVKVLEILDTVEWETQQLKVFEGLKAGNSVLDAIHKEMSIEAVENLMMETAEAQEYENEISLMIGGSLTVEDEDAVMNELAEIERKEAEALGQALPEAPSSALVTDEINVQVEKKEQKIPASKPKKEKKQQKKEPVLVAS